MDLITKQSIETYLGKEIKKFEVWAKVLFVVPAAGRATFVSKTKYEAAQAPKPPKFPTILVGFSSTGLKKLGYKTCPFVWTKGELIEQLLKIKTKQPKLNLLQFQTDKENFIHYIIESDTGLYEDQLGNQIQVSPEGKAYKING